MRLNEAELLRSVFDFLDTVIDDYGLYLFMGFVYVAIPFLVWVLCGGLRRRLLKGRPMPHLPPVILIHLPGRPPEPPETFNPFPPYHDRPDCHCDDEHWD
jgi:hypothetical protein